MRNIAKIFMNSRVFRLTRQQVLKARVRHRRHVLSFSLLWLVLLNSLQTSCFVVDHHREQRNVCSSSLCRHQVNVLVRSRQSRSLPFPLFSSPSSFNKTSQKQKTASRKTQLRWILQSIERMQAAGTLESALGSAASDELVQALTLLANAATTSQVTQAGRRLQSLPLLPSDNKNSDHDNDDAGHSNTQAFDSAILQQRQEVLERVIKATAMTGLNTLAWNYVVAGFLDRGQVPSIQVQDALCSSLRRSGKLERLEEFLLRLGKIATSFEENKLPDESSSSKVSTAAFNIYLAALLSLSARFSGRKMTDRMVSSDRLDKAWQWISRAPTELKVVPDAVSYATVLQGAHRNQSLVSTVWDHMMKQGIPRNIVAYNARLRVLSPDDALGLWERILQDKSVSPDRYTIDLMLLPLIRSGRTGEVEALLDDFITSNSDNVVADAVAAFLVTLVRGGELAAARSIFQTFLVPSLSSVVTADAGRLRLVMPTTRHINILLEGHRQQVQKVQRGGKHIDDTNVAHLYEEAWELFRLMLASSVHPDEYTTTSMMGLCRLPEELTSLLLTACDEFQIECSGVVLRAAITAYGNLGDPSSACWMLASHGCDHLDLRFLNVFMASMGNAIEAGFFGSMDVMASVAASELSEVYRTEDAPSDHPIVSIVDGSTCIEAVPLMLHAMSNPHKSDKQRLPKPNSQTYCVAASALQYSIAPSAELALRIFRNATGSGVPADGRFVNAIFRCFGDDINCAISAWKNEIRKPCLEYEIRERKRPPPERRLKGKNLVAAYNGLLHVCGRAMRPDIALRLAYAMNKEGLEPNEVSMNCYRSGKRLRGSVIPTLAEKLKLIDQFESLLYVECTKYDSNDKRRAGERRVRIIM